MNLSDALATLHAQPFDGTWPEPNPRDRFYVRGPAVISFSGGRTSAYMLFRILWAHGGRLPNSVVVVFANTGREMPGTLDFVRDVARHWRVNIVWLEYRRDPATSRVWSQEVTYETASRHGEPFRALLVERQMLPNPAMRFCITELKIRVVKRWVLAVLGWDRWINLIGLRGDELHRVVKKGIDNARRKERFRVSCPLAKVRITKNGHVLPFWRAQQFDLRLRGPWEGNCDGCFLKSIAAKLRIAQDYPERAEAWAWDEENLSSKGTVNPAVALYRKDGRSYRQQLDYVRQNPRLPIDPGEDVFDPMATCDGGCGV